MNLTQEQIASARSFLSILQPLQNQVRFPITYPTPISFQKLDRLDKGKLFLIKNKCQSYAIELFQQCLPKYRLQNLAIEHITTRVFHELKDINLLNTTEIILTNGCCNQTSCPTSIFIGCLLEAISYYY